MHGFGRGANEHDAVVAAHLGELRVLGQEAVAGVDRIGSRNNRGGEQVRDVQVGVFGGRRADADGLVGQQHGERLGVGLGVGHHRLDSKFAGRPQHAQRDLSPVGDQDFFKHSASQDAKRQTPNAESETPKRLASCVLRLAFMLGQSGTGPARTPPARRCPPGCPPPCPRPRSRSRSSASWPR